MNKDKKNEIDALTIITDTRSSLLNKHAMSIGEHAKFGLERAYEIEKETLCYYRKLGRLKEENQ